MENSKPKFIGILYSPAMIAAKREGRKDVTRRVASLDDSEDEISFAAPCQAGDIHWIRETYYAYGFWNKSIEVFTETGRNKRLFVADPDTPITFDIDELGHLLIRENTYNGIGWFKRMGRFMPKVYCRMWDEVVSVRLERLQAITEEDAVREGIQTFFGTAIERPSYKDYSNEGGWSTSPRYSYSTLWDSINPHLPWSINPWVFRIETRPILERPKDFLK